MPPFKKKREGDRLFSKFGEAWTDYDQGVPDYLPRLTPYPGRGDRIWSMALFVENSEDGTLLSVALGALILLFRILL